MAESEKLYMQSPLVLWVETFKANDGHPLEYQDLCDGVFLNDVMQQIDPRLAYDNVNRNVEDISVRLHNWDILVRNIRGYYRDVLQQVLITRLPNITAICREPEKESSFAEIRKCLLLILGCAVQCERKEDFIDKIMAMDIAAQTEIVENIKEVTDDYETFLSVQRPESPNSSATYVEKMFHHLNRLIKERDECADSASDISQERDYYMSQAEGKPRVETLQVSPDKHHLALELAECKAKLRHLRHELEDHQEQLTDVKEELQQSANNCTLLKNENAALLQEARATRSLRDELDIVKEKAAKVDLYEKEILKYKERLNELEFFKARTEELKEDNAILEETKAMLEDQLSNSRKRIETVLEMEAEMARYRQQVEELTKERDSDREKIEYLTGENARLEFEKKSSMNESASLETELTAARSRIGNMGGSLSDQLSETSHARILRLELENQRLSAKLAEMKETSLIQSAEISLELEKENQRLVKRIEKLQTSACESSEQVIQIESDLSAVKEEKERLVKALDAIKENSERQVHELERENEQLSQALDTIRARSEKTSDAKVKDLERENKRLHEAVTAKNSELNRLEFELRQVQRSSHQLQENTVRIKELEQDTQALEKENAELHRKVATLQHSADKLETIEQESSDLDVENRKLQKTVETLQAANQRRDQVEQENIHLTLETQRLQKTIESLKSESDRALELEAEKLELAQQIQQLQKQLEGQKMQKLKHEQMEFEVIDLGNENQRLQKSLEVTNRRLQQLEKDNNDIELENERLVKELDTLKVTVKRLEERDKEATQLDTELQKLNKDKTALEKENRKLRQSAELKDSSLEDITGKFQAMDKECKSLRRSVDKMKETCAKVKDLEKDNKDLVQELNMDRRTLATLREDLVNEKIHCQELQNDLDQLTSELEKVGINTDKLAMVEQTKDANRYKALETMIEETLQKSSELKEEKIRALESRLQESKGRNLKLQEDLCNSQRECEELKQRLEEEGEFRRQGMVREEPVGRVASMAREKDRLTKSPPSNNTAKELFDLKDHLVELERSNARLLADNENLKGHVSHLSEQCQKVEGQLTQSQAQHATLQGHYSSLKEQNAKLQVEYSTLQSQTSSSLSAQDSLKHQLSRLESDHEALTHKHEGLVSSHQSLVTDHGSLQHLHEQLTAEYESLVSEHSSLKSLHKSLKSELRAAQEQLNSFLKGKDDVNKLWEMLEQERDQLKRELMSLGNLKSDYNRLTEDHKQLGAAYDKLSQDYSNVLASHKQVKTDYNSLQLKSTEQQGELNEAKENLSVAEVEFQKLENKMEAVYQINERLENENQALLLQIQQLLNQNHELLTQALNSKDHFAEEEKAYLERLSELRRQKERLEEKIMEHYKNRISPKKKGLGALLARKARGIISRAPKRSKSRTNLSELNDNSSSGSTEHVNDGRRLDKRRHSSFGVQPDSSPKLAKQNKSLAKSYSELHRAPFSNETGIRGAKSSEDVNDGEAALLPGLGRPYRGESDGDGVRSTTPGIPRRTPGRSSPGSEMLTLDQFLKEANKSPRTTSTSDNTPGENKFNQSNHANDNESRSSNNSSSHQQREMEKSQHHFLSDIPDVAAATPNSARHDMQSSRLSRLSGGSGNDNSSFGSTGMLHGDVFSSTPKIDPETSSVLVQHNESGSLNSFTKLADMGRGDHPSMGEGEGHYLSHKRLSAGDDWGRSSSQESSPYASTTRVNQYGGVHESSPGLVDHRGRSASSSHPFYPSSQPTLYNSNNNNISRGIPPVPTEPPPPIPATDRLDRLTMLASGNDPLNKSSNYGPPHEHSFQNPDQDDSRRGSAGGPTDIERKKSQGAADRHQGLPSHFQPPVPRSQPPGGATNTSGVDNSIVSGHNARRPPSNVSTFQNNGQIVRARPASVMGPGVHVRGVIQRPPGEGRPRQQQQQQQQLARRESAGGPLSRQNFNSATSNGGDGPAERPKSVPPHLFNKPAEDYARPSQAKEMPVPPPRRDSNRNAPDGGDGREALQSAQSSITLIREPGRPASRPSLSSTSSNQDSNRSQQQTYSSPSSSQLSPNPSISGNSYSPRDMQGNGSPQVISGEARYPSPSIASSRPGSQSRPGYLPVNSSERSGSVSAQPGWSSQPRYGSTSSSSRPSQPPPAAMPRSQSSMGVPMSSSSPSTGASGYNRSTTPGPQPGGRRDIPPNPYNSTSSRPPSSSSSPFVRNHSSSDSHPPQALQSDTPQHFGDTRGARLVRGDSEPREFQPGSRDMQGQGSQRRVSDRYQGSGSGNAPHPLPRSHSQGPPLQRDPSLSPNATTNGPMSGNSSRRDVPQHPPPPIPQAVPPQIRSQGKPPYSHLQNQGTSAPGKSSNPLLSQMRSPGGELTDRVLSQPLPNSHSQSKPSPGRPESSNEDGAAAQQPPQQPKTSNSIWYEYGCV